MINASYTPPTANKAAVHNRYQLLLTYWNERNHDELAKLFDRDGILICADGSQLNGQLEIETSLKRMFEHHPTSAYVSKVKEIRNLSEDVVLLRAFVGMMRPGLTNINPAYNAIQSMIAAKCGRRWDIKLFQNTPTQFQGKVELSKQLTGESYNLGREAA